MSTQEIENNKLIAFFMGAVDETGYFQASTIGKTKVPTGRMYMTDGFPDNMHLCSEADLKYHTSWDWLMPVVEKIELLGYVVIIQQRTCYIQSHDTLSIISTAQFFDSKIETCWQAIKSFINWHKAIKPLTNKTERE